MRTILTGVALASVLAVGFAGSAEAAESQRIDIQIRKLSDNLANQYKELFQKEWRYQRLAVLDFEATGEAKDNGLGRLVASQLNSLLVRDHGFNLVERRAISKVLEEQALAQTGVLGAEAANKVSELLDAQALIVGDIGEAGPKMVITARAISADKGTVLAAESITFDRASLIALSKDSVVLQTKIGAMARSMLLPGWGQYYSGHTIQGAISLAMVVTPFAMALGFHLDGEAVKSRYESATKDNLKGKSRNNCPGQTEVSCTVQYLRREAESDFEMRNIFIGVGAAAWAANWLWAYAVGRNGADEAEGFSALGAPTATIAPDGSGANISWGFRF